jgi:hypothetical protein
MLSGQEDTIMQLDTQRLALEEAIATGEEELAAYVRTLRL